MTGAQPEAGQPISRKGKWLTLLGCGVIWLVIGWVALAASALFLVNPRISAGFWLMVIFVVWAGLFALFAWAVLRSKEL